MIAQELINYLIPPLKPTDDGHKAMVWMEEFRCKHLPVVDKGRLLGFLSEDVARRMSATCPWWPWSAPSSTTKG
jgi:CBS domain-containing protein